MSTIKKQARVQRSAHRKEVQRKHRVNVADKQQNRERTTTAAGLFVALIKERGFVRDQSSGKYTKRCDNGDTHTIVMDYIPGKAALLIINEGSGGAGTYGECAHSVHYDECPLPTKTLEYLARQQAKAKPVRQHKQRTKFVPPAWKNNLKEAAEQIKDAAVVEELRVLLGNKED